MFFLTNIVAAWDLPEKWDLGPGMSTGRNLRPGTWNSKICRWDAEPGIRKVGPGVRDPKIFKWDSGPGIPKVKPGTSNFL